MDKAKLDILITGGKQTGEAAVKLKTNNEGFMKTPKENQSKYGALVSMLVMVGIVAVGLAGWFIWLSQSKTEEPVQNTQSTSKLASTEDTDTWKTYSNEHVMFKYPPTWNVGYDANNPSGAVIIVAPVDPEIMLIDAATNSAKQFANTRLQLNIVANPSWEANKIPSCAEKDGAPNMCKIYSSEAIATPTIRQANLVVSDCDGGVKHPVCMSVVDDPSAKVGANDYKLGVTLHDKVRLIQANIKFQAPSGLTSSDGWLADIAEFKKTASYRDMVEIINTAEVQ